MQRSKSWKQAQIAQTYRPWNLQALKAAKGARSTAAPETPTPDQPSTPVTPTTPGEPYAFKQPAKDDDSPPETINWADLNDKTVLTPAQTPTQDKPSFAFMSQTTPEATPIDELPPWVDAPELRPRRDTVESTQSSGSNWGAGPLVNDWSQFESKMIKSPTEDVISPSTSMESTTSKPLVGELIDLDGGAAPSPVNPSAWGQYGVVPHRTSPVRPRGRSQQVEDEDDDDLEWVTNDTYLPAQNLRRYSRDQLFGLNNYTVTEIGNDAAHRIDEHIRRQSAARAAAANAARLEPKPAIRVLREVRQPPDDHSGGFTPGIPRPHIAGTLTIYDAL